MTESEIREILAENSRRRKNRHKRERYDPLSGRGCGGSRLRVKAPDGTEVSVPRAMLRDPGYPAATGDSIAWQKLRCRHDFEYWCARCVVIRDKLSGRDIPLRLNGPQRRLTAVMEKERLAGRPIRVILLKARQWGGSTLVQIYMAWIQSCHCRNWHSLICAHVKDTSSVIRGIYSKLLDNYPAELWEGDEAPLFRPFERSTNVRMIAGRGCRVTVGSAENQEAVRGADFAMAHLSETAFWPSTLTRSPESFIRAVCGAVALVPLSLVVMESTANGVGNYFHTEWLRCKAGKGDKVAVFVPWYEIEIYRLEVPRPAEFVASWTDQDRALWDRGLCLDQIYWHSRKRREYSSPEQMSAEFPTTDVEAFVNTGSGVFAAARLELRREGALIPASGAVLEQWESPMAGEAYVVAVDVGGRSAASDWSVIAVLTCGERPRVVAQWRGHTDHDRLAHTAIMVARIYNGALLAIESNTLETEANGDCNLFTLNRIAREYGNVYQRRSYDSVNGCETTRVGFHTNRSTKAMLISGLIGAVRDGAYVERDAEACNELTTYEQLSNGSFAAKRGYHDDILMTRAMALHVIGERWAPPAPRAQREIWLATQ